ncbi:MAG: hypothetical protein M1816_006251 [Peltula sp. TS41687]|nr:MAG: hypothetical protein M1816_006251 [Peltula sp. TS41687]
MTSTFITESDPALDRFIRQPVSRDMIRYLAHQACSVIRCEQTPVRTNQPRSKLPPTPPHTPPPSGPTSVSPDEVALPSVEAFISSLVQRSHVQVATLMSSLVYLDRLRRRLPAVAKGMKCTVHRIFLASLILAAKNLNDSSPKNKHWARYSCVPGHAGFGFSLTEVNLMEKQLLFLLDWDMRITQEDLLTHLEPFLAPIRVQLRLQAEEDEMARQIRSREEEVIRPQQTAERRAREGPVRLEVPLCESPVSMLDPSCSGGDFPRPALGNSTSSSRSLDARSYHLRQPSLSPAPSLDVPRLTRSGTAETRSTYSRSSSALSTPASSSGSYVDLDEQVHVVSEGASPSSSTTHLAPLQAVKIHTLSDGLDRFDDGKPPKKLKTGGNFISRFLGVGSERYEKLNLRARPHQQYV